MMTESSKVKLATGTPSRGIDRIIGSVPEEFPGVEKCFSVLVETGVYSPDDETDEQVCFLSIAAVLCAHSVLISTPVTTLASSAKACTLLNSEKFLTCQDLLKS